MRSGARSARFYYVLDVIRFFRPFAIRNFTKIQPINPMFKINTRLAFRNLAKNKLYSTINIAGLALGIAACLMIAHYVLFELSFDQQFPNSESLYRVHTSYYQNGDYQTTNKGCGFGLGPALRRDIPEIAKSSLIHHYNRGAIVSHVQDSLSLTPIRERGLMFAEPAFLSMFSLNFIHGNPQTALNHHKSVIITESMVQKYFGQDPGSVVGKTLRIVGEWGESGDHEISAVVSDFPSNSHIRFDFLLPIANVLKTDQYQNEEARWNWTNFNLYVQLTPLATEAGVEQKISGLMKTYMGESLERNGENRILQLQRITDIHLKSEVNNEAGGDLQSVYFLSIIAFFILIIAWVNFVNLSTARAYDRSREVGVKKSMGAKRHQLIGQFLVESFWINILAMVAGLLITYLLLPYLSSVVGQDLHLDLTNTHMQIMLIVLILTGPMVAGAYPAFFMSSFDTIKALKGRHGQNPGRISLRKTLVVFQFIISTLMITGTFAVTEQLRFMQESKTGIDMEQILVVKGPSEDNMGGFESFRNSVTSLPSVKSFSTSRSIPGAGYNWSTELIKEGAERSSRKGAKITWVDHHFFETYQLEMVAGRDFTDAIRSVGEPGSDEVIIVNGLIINETVVKLFDLGTPEQALNEKLIANGIPLKIRGVMKDHNWSSLHTPVSAGIMMYTPDNNEYFSLRLNSSIIDETVDVIKSAYLENFPGNPVELYFLNDFFDRQYQSDQQFETIFRSFAMFAILASCLGLFGLTAFNMLHKRKEVGVRKVLGASLTSISYTFSKGYLVMILFASALALPLAYIGIDRWIRNFAYQTPITLKLLVLPVVILMLIALLTISFHAIKTAQTNPVNCLRNE